MNSFSIEPRKEADGEASPVASSAHSVIRLGEGWPNARQMSVSSAEVPLAQQRVSVATELSPIKTDSMMPLATREPHHNGVPGQYHGDDQDGFDKAGEESTDYDFSSSGEDSSDYEFQSDGDDTEEAWEETSVAKHREQKMKDPDAELESEENSDTDCDDSDEVYEQKRRKRAPARRAPRGKGKKTTNIKPRRVREPLAVSDEEEDEYTSDDLDDGAKYEEDGERRLLGTALTLENPFEIPFSRPEDIAPHVDRIIADRDNGQEFLVKWRGLSHWHNTWEREDRIGAFAGARKLDNYRLATDREEVDVEEFKVIERVIDEYHDHPEDAGQGMGEKVSTFYLCKWMDLPYSECTWEPRADVLKEHTIQVDEYVVRSQSGGIPTCGKTWNRRCTFKKLTRTPAYITQYGDLRDYQLEGVNWLLYSWCHGTNVILADEMGLGKTIQSIAFISALHHEYAFTGPVLVVVPLSTISAWQREFSRWAPSLSTLLYLGDSRSRGIQRHYEWFAEDNATENIARHPHRRGQGTSRDGRPWPLFHVLLTTFELVLKDKEYLQQVDWRMLLVDEGHRLKNASSQLHEVLDQLSPTSRLLVTGTPLQNSLLELWSLLHFLMPTKFSDYNDFVERYGPPQSGGGSDDAFTADVRLERLHKLLKPHLLRRMKKDVEKSLPAKIERILRVEMTEQQKTLSRLIITRNYRELASHSKAVGSLNNILIELKKVCNHPLLRREVNEASLDEILRGSGKMALLDQLLMRLHRDGHRVLIFSQMVRMLDILSNYLTLRGFSFQRLDGTTSSEERKRSIAAFNAAGSPDFCFLLSTRAGGLGINLETADTVIIYDSDWNPQNDLQAMARAHRIGQRRSVNIYRLVCKSSVEETILERAKQKMILDHLVIQSMDTSGRRDPRGGLPEGGGKRITRDELDAILKFGAQDLFKADEATQDSGSNTDVKPAEVDLDEILARADSSGDASTERSNLSGGHFFDQFKVAEFGPMKEWDEILPADEVTKAKNAIVEEDEQKREIALQEALLTSASKRRRPALLKSQDAERFASNRNSPYKGTRLPSKASPSKRSLMVATSRASNETIKLTKGITRTLIASLLRFGCLVEDRFDVIVADVVAEEGKSQRGTTSTSIREDNLRHAMQVIKCKLEECQEESCKLSNAVHVNLAQLRERHKILCFLQQRLSPFCPDRLSQFTITERGIKSVSTVGARRWMIDWRTPEDDARLLVGVYRHGFGRWKEIASDPALGLEKLKESLIDKAAEEKFLPKDLHLARRVENVLIHMMLGAPPVGGPGEKRKLALGREPIESTETADSVKDSTSSLNEGHSIPDTNKEALKKLLKPVREDIAFIASLTAETFSSNLDEICNSLLHVGLHIQRESEGTNDEHLWSYLASFWPTEISGQELKHLYGRIAKERSAKQVIAH